MDAGTVSLSLRTSRELISYQNVKSAYASFGNGTPVQKRAGTGEEGENAPGRGVDMLQLGQGAQFGFNETTTLTILREQTEISLSGRMEDVKAVLAEKGYFAKPAQGLGQLDLSPEATARRIVDFAVGFFPAYQENHPELGEEEALGSFLDMVKGAVDEGFRQAREIMGGMSPNGQIPADTQNTVDQTYALVQDYLEEFRLSVLEGTFDPEAAVQRQNELRNQFGLWNERATEVTSSAEERRDETSSVLAA